MRIVRAAVIGWSLLAAVAACDGACGSKPKETGTRDPLARCGTTRGQVRVRTVEVPTWEALSTGDSLFAGNSVQTAQESQALIEYMSGAKLEVGPSSLVVIEEPARGDAEKGHLEKIAVRSGVVRGTVAAGGRPIVVTTPDGKELQLAAASDSERVSYRLRVTDEGKVEVAVTEGKAVLVGADGNQVVVGVGEARDVEANGMAGPAIALPSFPELVAPGIDATVAYEEGMEITLAWRDVAEAASYHLQVARDQSFFRLAMDQTLAETSARFRPSAEGTYYWRISSRNAQRREGEFGFSRRLEVTRDAVLDLLVAPPDDASLTYSGDDNPIAMFSWRAAVPPAPYVLVVAKRPDLGDEPVLSVSTETQEYQTKKLTRGVYYWGVYVQRDQDKKPIFRKARKLTIKRDRIGSMPDKLEWK